EKQRAALGLEHDVTFLGFIDRIPAFLSALDVLAVPSRFEGLGTIILEGLAAGCAVAATDVGGIPEMIRPGVTGLLTPVEDAPRLAANLAALTRDPGLARRLVEGGRTLVAQAFSVGAMVGGNLDVYRQVLL